MELPEIRELCVRSAETYLGWLRGNGRGCEEIPVVSVRVGEEGVHLFTLGGRLFDPDNVIVEDRRHQRRFIAGDMVIQAYDPDRNLLVVKFHDRALNLQDVDPKDLFVIADLTFLVDNVRKWYVEKGTQLSTLQQTPVPRISVGPFAVQPSALQQQAIEVVLSTPVTYVWGCPGTGKTRCVLANAVLSYLRAGKRVGVFAPTNNALEQVFTGLLEALAMHSSVSRQRFLRVGVPSRKFAERFPEVCEVQGLQKRIAETAEQIRNLRLVLDCRRGVLVLNSAENALGEVRQLEGLLRQRTELALKQQELTRQRQLIESESRGLFAKIENLLPQRKRERQAQLDGLGREFAHIEQELKGVEAAADACMAMLRRTKTPSDKLNSLLNRVTFQSLGATREDIERLKEATADFIETKRLLTEQYKDSSEDELRSLLAEHEHSLQELQRLTLEERLESALVVGMTLDAYIGRLRDVPLHFEHVFLDEAAYAPVIKALTLFRQGVPVTFLGDHKQLPPVCEMNDEDFSLPQYCRVSIWKKSAMFCDALFSRSEEDFLSSCLNTDDPPFSFIRQVTLTETHRFGETLTRILSRAVYDGLPLQSVAPHGDLKITVVDAPLRQPPAEKRKNSAESAAIGRYLDTTLRAVDARDESAYAILTPYLNQVATINSSLPVARREQRVLTVHKSQGREWEVVVLSVVDGPWNTPWFTNSQRPESLRVLNTAVSRARQSLVIVCNLDFWEQQHPDQLITQLIQDATVADASESIR